MVRIRTPVKLGVIFVFCISIISGTAFGATAATSQSIDYQTGIEYNQTEAGTAQATTSVDPGDSIQSAVDAASAGDTIKLSAGTYEQSVTIDKKLTLIAPKGATIDGDSLNAEDGIIIDSSGITVSDVEVRRFNDDGIEVRANNAVLSNITARLNDGRGVEAESQIIESLTINDSRITGNSYTGLYVASDGAKVSITASHFSGNDQGIKTVDVDSVEIAQSTVTDNSDYGANLENPQSVTATDSKFRNNGDDGLLASTSGALGRETIIRNVTARLNSDNGIDIRGTADPDSVSIIDSYTADNDDNGVYVSAETVNVTHLEATNNGDGGLVADSKDPATVSVTDSVLSTNGGSDYDYSHGLVIEDGSHTVIKNVTTNENYYDGIKLNTNNALGRTTDVSNTTARLNGDEGLEIAGTADTDEFSINSSTITNNGDNGLYVKAEAVNATGVEATDNGDGGLVLDSNSAAEMTIRDADFSANGGDDYDYSHGIYVADAGQAVISNVTTNDNHYDGIRFDTGSSLGRNVSATNVTARLNGDDGIDVAGTDDPDELVVLNASVSDNDDNGVTATTTRVEIRNVVADGNGDGGAVLVDDVSDVVVAESSLSENGAEDYDYESGIYVGDPTNVVVNGTTTANNEDAGIAIDRIDATSRTIQLADVVTTANYDGIRIASSPDSDSIEVVDGTIKSNEYNGLEVDSSAMTVKQSVIAKNGEKGVVFRGDTATGSVIDSSEILGNGEHGIVNENGGLVDATGNWWGDANGPSENACVGNVDCSAHLTNPPGATLTLVPDQTTLGVNDSTTVDIVLEGAVNGLSGYQFTVELSNANNAISIANLSAIDDATASQVTIGLENQTATVDVDLTETPIDGSQQMTVGTVTLDSSEDGSATLSLAGNASVSDATGSEYDLSVGDGSQVEASSGPGPVIGDRAPRDLDGDGVYADINGDGSVNIIDVQALFANSDRQAVQNNPKAFDVNGDGSFNVVDVQALFQVATA